MRSVLLIGLVVTGVGCGFPTGEFILGQSSTDVGTPVDVPAVDTGAVDAALTDVVQKDFPTVDLPTTDAPTTDTPTTDVTGDTAEDLGVDVGVDVGAIDAGADAPATDAGDDVPADVGFDVGTDVRADAGSDVPADLGVDVPRDTGTDVPVDTGADVPRDVGFDVGTDVPRDTGTDVPVDTGPVACRTTAPPCTAPTVCSAGFCVSACPAGQTVCNGSCVDLRTDRTNCGLCGRVCAATQACSAGACITPVGTYVFASVRPTFIDACALMAPPRILPGADDAVGPALSLPFAFRYAGVAYSALRPSSNGYVIFGNTAESHDNNYYPSPTPLPDGNRPRPAVFVLNSDLYMRTMAGICFAVVGLAPARRAVVEWLDGSECCGDTNPAHFTFELVLNESDGSMDFNYQTITYANSSRVFLTGVQNETATVGSTYAVSTTVMPTTPGSNFSLHVTPAP